MTEGWIPACAGMTEGKWWIKYGKIASCKGYRVSEKPKKAKKNVEFTDFSKIETRLKALYVRF
jgi:hypothetical protein